MLKESKLYSGRLWLHRVDSLVGKARNGRYYRKYRLIDDNKFYTLTVFSNKASDLFSLPETMVVRQLPVNQSTVKINDKEYQVYATELQQLLACMKQEK